eukprot:scaffold199929_cov21-Tisochrysis_lutea.AAC.6
MDSFEEEGANAEETVLALNEEKEAHWPKASLVLVAVGGSMPMMIMFKFKGRMPVMRQSCPVCHWWERASGAAALTAGTLSPQAAVPCLTKHHVCCKHNQNR